MSDVTDHDLFEGLQFLLEEERTLLLTGALDALPDMLARKEVLFEALQDLEDADAETFAPLLALSQRNQVLLESAQNGIRATTERMGTMRRVRTSLETYTNQGQRKAVTLTSGQRVEKRA